MTSKFEAYHPQLPDDIKLLLPVLGKIRQHDPIHIICEYEDNSVWVQGLFDTAGVDLVWLGVAVAQTNVFPNENPMVKFGLLQREDEKFPTIVYLWENGASIFTRIEEWIWWLKNLADEIKAKDEEAMRHNNSQVRLRR